MQKNTLLPRIGLLASAFMVAALAFIMLVIPTQGSIKTLAENCENPPVTPTFNYWPVTYDDVNTPFCHDFPAIDAAKHTTSGSPVFSQNEADWQNGVELAVGDNGVALGYIHNGAANNLPTTQTTARNVRIKTETDTTVGNSHNIRVTYTADNAPSYTQVFTVHTPSNAKLEVVPNSGNFYAFDGGLIGDMQNVNLGNSTFELGDLDACFEYSLFFSFKFKVVSEAPQTPTLSVNKTVRKFDTGDYAPSVTVNGGDRLQYKVVVTNNGPAVANTVTLTDNSVAGISVDPGSTTVENPATNSSLPVWQGAIPGTINLGNLNPGESRVIKYTAHASTACNTYVNTATAQASNAAAVSATATVIVANCSTGTPNLAIKKLVKNDTLNTDYNDDSVQARTGDRVTFKVTVSNPGSAAVTNVHLSDVIPSGLSIEPNSIMFDGQRAPALPPLAPLNDVSLGTINAGQSRVITFTTQVLAVGPTTICNVATATGTNVNKVSDQACVQIVVIPKPGTPNIVISKRAFNNTKNVDATTVNASREDFITYSLITTNTGTADSVNYVVSDDLSQVLPLADMVEANGGTVNGQTISYPAITIHPGETVVKTFKVRVKASLAANLSYQMKNTYGNTIVINIPGKQVFEAPKTGAAGTSAAVFAGLITAGVAVLRKGRSIVKFISA